MKFNSLGIIFVIFIFMFSFKEQVAMACDEVVTVELQIKQLEALNLSDDVPIVDDFEDEIAFFYAIYEVDQDGVIVSAELGKFERSYDVDEVHTSIPSIELEVDTENSIHIMLLLVEVDSGNFILEDYIDPTSEADTDEPIGEECVIAIVIALGEAVMRNPRGLMALAGCTGDIGNIVNLFTGGNDDIYEPLFITLPHDLCGGYESEGAFTFTWSNKITTSSQYYMEYSIEVD